MPLSNSASGHYCPTGAFLLLALLSIIPPAAFANYPSDNDPVAEIDRQRLYVDRMMRDIERQRSDQEAEEKAESGRRVKFQKKMEEARLAEQLKGLSGTLSGLPELPSFSGRFEAGLDLPDSKEAK